MKSWSEQIHLPAPLRDARQLGIAPMVATAGSAPPEQWQASYDLGRLDGEKSLSEQLIKQRAEMHELFQGVLHSLKEAVPQVVLDTESMLVSLAMEIALKLVGDIAITAPIVEAAVREAMVEVEGSAHLTVRLNPADLELLQTANSPLLGPSAENNEINFVASPDVSRGGCVVQTRFGTVDARRETKFDLLKRSLLS